MLIDQSSPVAAQLADAGLFRQQCFVGGEWIGVGKTAIANPHDQSVLGMVPLFGAVETKLAIEAANAALPEWRARSAKEHSDARRISGTEVSLLQYFLTGTSQLSSSRKSELYQ